VTLLHYTLADAQQWAAFSGDENPIHFDLAAARQMGAGQLSVRSEARCPLPAVPP